MRKDIEDTLAWNIVMLVAFTIGTGAVGFVLGLIIFFIASEGYILWQEVIMIILIFIVLAAMTATVVVKIIKVIRIARG